MKFSIIVPVYNEEMMIKGCLSSLANIDYPKKDYEVVIVNDGSTDDTRRNIEKFVVREKKARFRLKNQENGGRATARENGAKLALYENLLFVDSRCEAHSDILKQIAKAKYNVIVGNALTNKANRLGRFGYLFRKKLYGGSFEEFEPIEITKKNFDDISKGTAGFFAKKKLFLSVATNLKMSKDSSDDTKLLSGLLQKTKILKSPDVKVTYYSRESLKDHIVHTYNRGPKFVDYYFRPGRKYFWHIIMLLVALIALLDLLFFYPTIFGYVILALLALDVLISIYLSEKFRDFFILLAFLPLTGAMFAAGIVKGIFMKVLGRY
ncbi:MAG: glycosyltransferase family A protein [archaeon]